MGKIIEGLWDCPFCGNKRIRAGQKTCPDCGHPQDENTKFYMPDEIKYVSEEEAEKISRNPDWQCSFCGSLNSDDLNVCKNCGATKEDSERNYFEMRQQEEEKKRKKEEKKEDGVTTVTWMTSRPVDGEIDQVMHEIADKYSKEKGGKWKM